MQRTAQNEITSLFANASEETQRRVRAALFQLELKQCEVEHLRRTPKDSRRKLTLLGGVCGGFFGASIGYSLGYTIDNASIESVSADFTTILTSLQTLIQDLKKKISPFSPEDCPPFHETQYLNLLGYLEFEIKELNKEIQARKAVNNKTSISRHLYCAVRENIPLPGINELGHFIGLKTDEEKLEEYLEILNTREAEAMIKAQERKMRVN